MGIFSLLENAVRQAARDLLGKARVPAIERLRTAHKRGELVLVLGSGASASYGLPSWEALLQALLISVQSKDEDGSVPVDHRDLAELFNHVFDPGPLIAGRYIRGSIDGSGEQRRGVLLEEKIRELLYADLPPEDFESSLMKEIRQLCAAPGNSPTLDAIITYNYDDILEHCLERLDLDIPFKPIYAIGMQPGSGQLPIYHVHGYLPRDGQITDAHRITLAEEAYHAQYMDVYSWNNMVQINKFRGRTCLFIGISLTDPNQRRLLDIALKQRGDDTHRHFLLRKKVDPADVRRRLDELGRGGVNGFSTGTSVAEVPADDSAQRVQKHLQAIESAAPDDKATDVAASLVELMHDFYEKDAESFGISTVWIDDFDEIPNILVEIRKRDTSA